MPIIYLKHPIHGTKVATMDAEAEYDEAQGWERYELVTQPEIVDEMVEELIAAPVNTLEKRTRRKTAE
jgi:hypothetical protein